MSDDGEKTFAPSEKRLRDAALKGDVLRSRELATAMTMIAALAWLRFAGTWLLDGMVGGLKSGFTFDHAVAV